MLQEILQLEVRVAVAQNQGLGVQELVPSRDLLTLERELDQGQEVLDLDQEAGPRIERV